MRATRCAGCNNQDLVERNGSEVGGMPGITYQYCDACGWSRAITKPGRRRALAPASRQANADARLAEIARTTLGLETLETRRSDGLDFHDLAVWQIKQALQAAYEAGRASAK
jgi:hypothetical protein